MARPNSGMFEKWLKEENLKKITEWSKLGLFDKQIAKNMGISLATYYLYKKKYPEIQEAIEEGKEVVDVEVENALLKRALGYNYTLRKQKVTKDGNIIDYEEQYHVPGETIAQIFWLKNRRPKEWRERVEVENEVKVNNGVITDLVEALKNDKENN